MPLFFLRPECLTDLLPQPSTPIWVTAFRQHLQRYFCPVERGLLTILHCRNAIFWISRKLWSQIKCHLSSRLSRNGSKSKKKLPILPDITFLIIAGPGWQPELFGRCYRNVCNIRLQQKYRPAWCSPICNAGADQFLFWLHRGLTTEDNFYVQT